MTDDRDDAAYWDALADRVASAAVRRTTTSSLEWVGASRVGWVTALLLAAAAFGFVMLPARQSAGRASLTDALAPRDDVGSALVLGEQPPAIGSLLLQTNARSRQ